MYDLGDTAPLSVDITDDAGEPIDAATVVLTIELPDGTTVTPDVDHPDVGRYQHDYVIAHAGTHTVRWTSTDPATALVDLLDARPAAPRYLVSLATMKRHLNLTGTDDDEELRGYIEAATDVAERHLGTTVVRTPVREHHHLRSRTTKLVLNRFPTTALTAVASEDGATTWDLDGLRLDETGVVTVTSGPALHGDLTVDYIAGPAIANPAHGLAVQIIAAHLWETQRAAGAGPQGPFGDDEVNTPAGQGWAIPYRALQLLGEPAPFVG